MHGCRISCRSGVKGLTGPITHLIKQGYIESLLPLDPWSICGLVYPSIDDLVLDAWFMVLATFGM
jgi:hypothetical protein